MKDETVIDFTPRQSVAHKALTDKVHTEILYGGAAGGGKSYLACAWIILLCIKYPRTRYLLGRAILKDVKQSTLLTFFQICQQWNIKPGRGYKYNAQESKITFANGSEVFLKDLFAYPSDPEFDSLGSTEYTGAAIDEASQVTEKAKNIVMSRLRYKLKDYNLIPKLLICSNPAKNWMYKDYYKPWRQDKLAEYRTFIQSFVQDNPHIDPHYITNLKKLDILSKQRLLYGNWEYDDNQAKLLEYDDIMSIFTNAKSKGEGLKYITADIAGLGRDKTVIILWEDWHIKRVWEVSKETLPQIQARMQKVADEYTVPRSRIGIDEMGVGTGLAHYMTGIKGFIAASAAHKSERGQLVKYGNLKAQCAWKLAGRIKQGVISCYEEIPSEYRNKLIEDLEQFEIKDPDKDGPLYLTKKEDVKQRIGRSPDFGDAMMIRAWFDLFQTRMVFLEDKAGVF